jgi:hypothetical protein
MTTPKKKEETAQVPFVNNNNNTNNINVNVHVPKPRKKGTSKKQEPQPTKPNWILKGFILALVGLIAAWLFNYAVQALERGNGKPPVIIDNPSVR